MEENIKKDFGESDRERLISILNELTELKDSYVSETRDW